MTASITTQAAIDMVRHSEQELIEMSGGRFSKENSYSSVTSYLYPVPSLDDSNWLQGGVATQSDASALMD
jgi:hypothetical protein